MQNITYLLIFTLDDRRFALPVSSVDRVFPVVEITPLPKAPDIVVGIVNVQGRVIPVVNIRMRFSIPEKEISINNKLIIAHTSRREVGIIVDAVSNVEGYPEKEIITAENILSGIEYIVGVVKLENGIILIHDIDRFLSIEEEKRLDDAVKMV
ncbi:MAG: purine-binding chemotaxis protein CheW [Nitrospirae bacterium]|nr:purine-binding chemotaxis protein CheW [Nitrospirota bacterium]